MLLADHRRLVCLFSMIFIADSITILFPHHPFTFIMCSESGADGDKFDSSTVP